MSGVERVVDDLGTRLYRLALRVAGAKEDAEAAINEALSAAEVTSPTASDEPSLLWLSRSVARAAHARLRRRRADRHPQPRLGLDDVMPPLDGDNSHVHRARLFLRKRLSDHFAATDAA